MSDKLKDRIRGVIALLFSIFCLWTASDAADPTANFSIPLALWVSFFLCGAVLFFLAFLAIMWGDWK